MALRVVGAGLPRTATRSLGIALEHLLDGPCYHMSVIPGHPFDLGDTWNLALQDRAPDWNETLGAYVAALDWPASLFWSELSEAYPDALIVLSVRDSAETWWESASQTFLPYARMAREPDWSEGRGLVELLERFAGTADWDDSGTLMSAYERHNARVRASAPAGLFLEWRPADGWGPICDALGTPVPTRPFPWVNRREDWG